MVLLIDVTFNWFKVGRLVCVVMMTPDQTLLSCIDGSDAVIDVKRAINGFIVTNYLTLITSTTELNQHKENCTTMHGKQCILLPSGKIK